MSGIIAIDHFLPRFFWLLIFSVVLNGQCQTPGFISTPAGATKLVHSGDTPLSADCSSSPLEVQDGPNFLTNAIQEIEFAVPGKLPTRFSPGWLHSWARGVHITLLSRPPPAHFS